MHKTQVCVTIDENLLKWVDERISDKEFHNKSHAFELGLTRLKADLEKKSKKEARIDRTYNHIPRT